MKSETAGKSRRVRQKNLFGAAAELVAVMHVAPLAKTVYTFQGQQKS
jgi:hypothetical protein